MNGPGSFERNLKKAYEDSAWRVDAYCRGLTSIFFSDDKELVDYAKSVCACCSVSEQCRQFAAKTHQTHGVWGGLTISQLRRYRRRIRRG